MVIQFVIELHKILFDTLNINFTMIASAMLESQYVQRQVGIRGDHVSFGLIAKFNHNRLKVCFVLLYISILVIRLLYFTMSHIIFPIILKQWSISK